MNTRVLSLVQRLSLFAWAMCLRQLYVVENKGLNMLLYLILESFSSYTQTDFVVTRMILYLFIHVGRETGDIVLVH